MLKTLLYPEEWPDSTLCFLLFQINNKNWFCLTPSHERVVLPSLEAPEMCFLISLSPDILNTFGFALDLSNVKHYAWHLQGIYDFWATWAGPQYHSVLLQLSPGCHWHLWYGYFWHCSCSKGEHQTDWKVLNCVHLTTLGFNVAQQRILLDYLKLFCGCFSYFFPPFFFSCISSQLLSLARWLATNPSRTDQYKW